MATHPNRASSKTRFRGMMTGLAVAVCATTGAFLGGEVLARLFVEPVDFLRPALIEDATLGRRIAPGSGGHDEWGFRNREVPESADIVAIGDSWTYGNEAPSNMSWPSQLARMTGRSVYNLGMGGFGPIQYLSLLRDSVRQLSPTDVVVALYLGNDMEDAYEMAYQLEGWSDYRRGHGDARVATQVRRVNTGRPLVFARSARAWLGRHSVLYGMVRYVLIRHLPTGKIPAMTADPNEYVDVRRADGTRVTVLYPPLRDDAVNPVRESVAEGEAIVLRLFEEMRNWRDTVDARLTVVLLPTKERVFAGVVSLTDVDEQRAVLERLVRNEEQLEARLTSKLVGLEIPVVQVVGVLQRVPLDEPIFTRSFDGHPVGGGYTVIARAVAEQLSSE